MPHISEEDVYVYRSIHVTAVVHTRGLYAVVNKLTKCLITGCKQKKITLDGWELCVPCKSRKVKILRLPLHQRGQC